MALPGTRENPIHVVSPRDLERATRHVRRPSPDQARAGNYQMAHVVVGGLPVSIETPLDGIRRGIGPDGVPWEVRMPADYGYIKRTEGADGDQVDVYLGSSAHDAHNLPVWIVDQCDADTKAYDEHKCLLGFPDVATAKRTYLAAFSDGKGRERVGAVVRLSFDEFRKWLSSGRTDRPLAMKSALGTSKAAPYGAPIACSCARCRGLQGGHMSTSTSAVAAVTEPKALGMFTGLFAKVMGRMTPEERVSLLQDATALTSSEIGKATSMLEHGDDHGNLGRVEDQWDGPPDDHIETVRTGGPDSKVPSGKVGVGPSQASSGNGAERMESHYSRPAPQGGVQAATERLGRDIAGIKSAMKSFVRVFEGFGAQVELLKSMSGAAPDGAAIQAMVEKAASEAVAKAFANLDKTIAKAVRPMITDAIAKAADKGDDKKAAAASEEDDSEEDGEAEQEEKSASESDLANEMKEDGEDEGDSEDGKAAAKSAAKFRVMAKTRLKWASRRIGNADDMAESNKPKSAARQIRMARFDVAKAAAYVEAAKALCDGAAGPSTTAIVSRIAKARKSLGQAQSDNQKTWPATTETKVGKADTAAAVATATGSNGDDLAKAIDQISKAASGMGMLKATVEEMINAVGNRQPNGGAGGGNLPPVFALAKSDPTAIASVEQELATMRDNNIISFDDFDRARDAMAKARMNLPPDHVQALVNRLPQPVQSLLNRIAA